MIQPRLAVILPVGVVLVLAGLRDSSATRQNQADRNRQMSHDAETRGLAEPFKGITTDGRIVPDLFSIRSTGVSTAPVENKAVSERHAPSFSHRLRKCPLVICIICGLQSLPPQRTWFED